MSDPGWLEASITAARPQAVGALLRHFRDLDLAEEAYQEACLRALAHWPRNGPPRDPAAWLIFVGRNVAVDHLRKKSRLQPLPDDESAVSDLGDAENDMAETLDHGATGDDVLRLFFVCCRPELPATQQIALALRIVAGLTPAQIARAFLVGVDAMEQRITRAKRKIAETRAIFESPGAAERAERLGAVAAMVYLMFNEGYSASLENADAREALCREAMRLTRLLIDLFPAEPELQGLLALMLLQHARRSARFDGAGEIVLLEDQDRSLWSRHEIAEGLALLDKALRHRVRGPYQVQAAIAALHARAQRAEDTDWSGVERLYATLERLQPSPVVTLNRAVALSKADGPQPALDLIEPLRERLANYVYLHGVRGALLASLGRAEEAQDEYRAAIAFTRSPAEAAHLRRRLDALGENQLK